MPIGLIVIALGAAFWVLKILLGMAHLGLQATVGRFVTPPTHRRIGQYEESEGYESLKKENFGVTAEWASDAVSKLPKD